MCHRIKSSSQTDEVARIQISSQEMWGGPARNSFFSDFPKVKAFTYPEIFDRDQNRGIEFTTPVKPDSGTRPGLVYWSGDRPGVRNEDDWAKIRVQVIFCNQVDPVYLAES
jgi:hypothetical protein